MKFRALVDSGAEVSLIHSRIFASLKDKPKVFKKKAHLQFTSLLWIEQGGEEDRT